MLSRPSMAIVTSLVIIIFNVQPALSVDPDFSIRRSFGTGRESTTSVAVGDMDGDGDLDIIAGNYGEQSLVYLNDGAGTFTSARSFGTASGYIECVAVGDLDGDGDLDIVTGTRGEQNAVYLNDGAGNFTSARNFGTGTDYTASVAVGDMDGDGDLDIITGNLREQNVVYLNDGAGNFTSARNFGTGTDTTDSMAVGDMDGDGDLDIITGNDNREQDAVYLNDGAGNFTVARNFGTGIDYTRSVAVGDMDGDGALDIIIGNVVQQSLVYLNDGAGNFTSARNFGTAWDSTDSVTVGDMDGDGDLDIVTGNNGQQNVVYLNDGAGNFTSARNFGTGTDYTASIAAGDMDGDGDLDIITGNGVEQNVVYLNNGAGNFTSARNFGTGTDTTGVVAGDMDGDGDLDIITGNDDGEQDVVYLNDGAGNFTVARNFGTGSDYTRSVAVGDMDGDGDLDIIAGNLGEQSVVHLNDGAGNFTSARNFGTDSGHTESVAVGDMDGDGDLDIVTGNDFGEQSVVYLNDGAGNFTTAHNFGTDSNNTQSVAVGDMDGDGDLDIIAGNPAQSVLCLNDGGGNFTSARNFGTASDNTESVAVGDMDGDGDLDIIAGNDGRQNVVYLNDGGGNFTAARNFGTGGDYTRSVAVGDMDGDGDLDIITGNNHQQDVVYLNDGGGNFTAARNFGTVSDFTWSVAVGDMDGDGDLDIFAGNLGGQSMVYLNDGAGKHKTHVLLARPVATKNANFYSTPVTLSISQIALSYQLVDAESDPVGGIKVQYSLDGGGRWLPAVAAPGTQTANLATSPSGVEHVYIWDTFTSGFFGQSDNVVLRLLAYAQPAQPVALGTYRYKNQAAGPFQRAYIATQTFPFRVRGTQVQVEDAASLPRPLSEALVYRLSSGQSNNALPYADRTGRPYRTNGQGFLQGRGELGVGDRLAALWPVAPANAITFTQNATLYQTNAKPTLESLDLQPVIAPGVQVLTVRGDNKLLLFNLDVALEWDARKDAQFMETLRFSLARASDLLFDWTNGQAALGQVRIFQDAKHYPVDSTFDPWTDSHIRIYASNRIRPSASVGGIISPTLTLSESVTIDGQTKVITYEPGQVRMGAVWNRYGETSGSLGDDWARALAHELGHFLFFQEDDYLGLDEQGMLVTVPAEGDPSTSCPSAMNDPYRESLSEFHPQAGWTGSGCTRTLSYQSTGRSDWQTIAQFYGLTQPTESFTAMNQGPNTQPLAVTQLQEFSPTLAAATVDVPIFSLTDAQKGGTYLPGPNAQAFLFQGDWLTDLGQPTLDQVQAWGARPNDRLCVFEPAAGYFGCEQVRSGDDQLAMEAKGAWQPEIAVTPVNSYTIAVSASAPLQGSSLCARLYPSDEPAKGAVPLQPMAAGAYGAVLPATAEPTLEGYVHLWVPDAADGGCSEPQDSPRLETVTGYAIGGNPIHRRARRTLTRAGGVHRRARRAPVISADGQVMVFGDALDLNQEQEWSFTLQATNSVPATPPGRTLVGQAYRLIASPNAPDLTGAAISFGYLGEQVPPGEEGFLRIYFWQEDSAVCQPLGLSAPCWQPLDTFRDTEYNLASAKTKGPGLYALLASLELPLTNVGWNSFAYSVQQAQAVPTALASIAGAYTIVYGYRPDRPGNEWSVYSPTAPDWANDLKQLEFGKGYWIYTTDAITLYLSNEPTVQAATTQGLTLPPAVVYGVLQPMGDFTPAPGMEVTAWVGDKLCGSSQVQSQGGQQVYVVKVAADDGGSFSGCGIQGRVVRIQVGDTVTAAETVWNNTRMVDTGAAQHLIFLPLASR